MSGTKRSAALSFEGGGLIINLEGYSDPGSGHFAFTDDELEPITEYDDETGARSDLMLAKLASSELLAIRDFLNEWLRDEAPAPLNGSTGLERPQASPLRQSSGAGGEDTPDLMAALQFYADPQNWQDFIARPPGRDSHYHSAHTHLDAGTRARAVLKALQASTPTLGGGDSSVSESTSEGLRPFASDTHNHSEKED